MGELKKMAYSLGGVTLLQVVAEGNPLEFRASSGLVLLDSNMSPWPWRIARSGMHTDGYDAGPSRMIVAELRRSVAGLGKENQLVGLWKNPWDHNDWYHKYLVGTTDGDFQKKWFCDLQ